MTRLWLLFFLSSSLQCMRQSAEGHRSTQQIICPMQCSCEGEQTVNMYCGFLADETFKTLRHVPLGIPPQVAILSLYNNRITTIPNDAFANLTELKSLNLRSNRLSALPKNIFRDLGALRSLNLGGNHLSSLHENAFDGLTSLQELFLDSNRLRSLPDTIFQSLPALRRLNLHNNTLKTFPERILQRTISLQVLWMNDNLLTRIERGTFRNLSRLVILHLSNNRIIELDQHVFKDTTSLKLLSVSYNNLTSLPRGIFTSLGRDAKVSLHNNPFVCDCRLRWLMQWINTRSLIYSRNSIKCSSPGKVAGRPVTTLFAHQFICKSAEWTQWTSWTPCPVTCGLGTRISMRMCEKIRDRAGRDGVYCQGEKIRWKSCTKSPCPIDGGWGSWTTWSECSKSCSSGKQTRYRNCTNPYPKFGGKKCAGSSVEVKTCNRMTDCIAHGKWTLWTPWSDCTVTCGMGKRYRIRACPDSHKCVGNATESVFCYLGPCPIDGQWTEWSKWSECSKTCSVGTKIRKRSCAAPSPMYGGLDCAGLSTDSMECTLSPCPRNGGWTTWAPWSACSKTCSNGNKSRIRHCSNPSPKFGGENCSGSSMHTEPCHLASCYVSKGWATWSNWTECTKTCSVGTRMRMRICLDQHVDQALRNCSGPEKEFDFCNLYPCPVHGGWSEWTNWTPCSTTCSNGTTNRTRDCNNPSPKHGGKTCSGIRHQWKVCVQMPCPIHGGWSEWTNWTPCSTTCSNGTTNRTRHCNNPAPKYGGKTCNGIGHQQKVCVQMPCPVHGGWSEWTNWTPCSTTCSNGTTNRTRHCNNPSPKHKGNSCTGFRHQSKFCNQKPCPVHGGWSEWTNWTPCSTSCSNGNANRTRHCNNPAPNYGGKTCNGIGHQQKVCVQMPCPVHGGWSEWTNWTPCSTKCSIGTTNRTRHCNNPAPNYGGKTCNGIGHQQKVCVQIPCPVHGGWSEWTYWTPCSTSCSNGTTNRTRHCNNPSPKHKGNSCTGFRHQSKVCNQKPCPVHGGWSEWTNWTPCSTTCSNGITNRTRHCNNPTPKYGGKTCNGIGHQWKVCNEKPCPVHGGWSEWTNWTPCSTSCSNGTSNRTRHCNNPSPNHRGNICTGVRHQWKVCNEKPCAVHGGWSEWTNWTPCSTSCSNGTANRTRDCNNPSPKHKGNSCTGFRHQWKVCNQKPCQVIGILSAWAQWSSCSKTCSYGTRTRARNCTTNSIEHKDTIIKCIGNLTQVGDCFLSHCPINGAWSSWGLWSPCSKTCSNGTISRNRTCSNPSPEYGGSQCQGHNYQMKQCKLLDCPIKAKWTKWSFWTSCNATCGPGHQMRYRECTKKKKKVNISQCNGKSTESRHCFAKPCPIDGQWGYWSAWSTCSTSCSIGRQERTRNCSSPKPQFGGKACAGTDKQIRVCYKMKCPKVHGWSSWSNWTGCSVSCGTGVQVRSRSCSNPRKKDGINACKGKSLMVRNCHLQSCDILRSNNVAWLPWSSWSQCSATCGRGHQMRWRFCFSLSMYRNESGNCSANSPFEVQSRICYKTPCNYSSVWTSWTKWEGCVEPCSVGIQRRVRYCLSNAVGIKCKGKAVELSPCRTEACPTRPPVTFPPFKKLGAPIPCPDPGTPLNGGRKFIDQIEFGSYYVSYHCREHYYLDGPKLRHCESNKSRWSDTLPSCRPVCGESSKLTNHKRLRILGGSTTIPGAYPWQVVLEFDTFQSNFNTFHCGGTLIAEDWVVTAAHCVVYKDSEIPYHGVRVFLGVHDITQRRWDQHVQVIPSAQIIAHPKFSWRTYDSDIALIRLRWRANVTDFVRPICLPNGYQRRLVKPRRKGVMLGWGVTETRKPATTLREALLPVVDHDACKKAYENETWPVTSNMLCAGYKNKSRDSCNRDSGGGFIFFDSRTRKKKWFLGGIISWGNPKCGIPGKYSVFTRINHKFVKWMKNQMSTFERRSQ